MVVRFATPSVVSLLATVMVTLSVGSLRRLMVKVAVSNNSEVLLLIALM